MNTGRGVFSNRSNALALEILLVATPMMTPLQDAVVFPNAKPAGLYRLLSTFTGLPYRCDP